MGVTVLPSWGRRSAALSSTRLFRAPQGSRGTDSLRLNSVSHDGRTLRVATGSDTRVSAGHKKRNLAWIGGGTGGGLLIGALAGGPVGAAICGSGAAIGLGGAA